RLIEMLGGVPGAGLPPLSKDPKEFRTVKSKDGVVGRAWTYAPPRAGLYFLFAAWKKDDVELGLWIQCDPGMKKRYEAGFAQVVSGFTFADERAGEIRSIDALDGLNITPAKRREIERGLLASWDVIASPNKNYVVIYDRKGKRNDKLARIVAERIEAI